MKRVHNVRPGLCSASQVTSLRMRPISWTAQSGCSANRRCISMTTCMARESSGIPILRRRIESESGCDRHIMLRRPVEGHLVIGLEAPRRAVLLEDGDDLVSDLDTVGRAATGEDRADHGSGKPVHPRSGGIGIETDLLRPDRQKRCVAWPECAYRCHGL